MTEREELEMWKAMYLRLLRGTDDAINILVQAEEATEDLYIEAGLSKEEFDADARPKERWIPIVLSSDSEKLSFAKAYHLSLKDGLEAARRFANAVNDTSAEKKPNE